MSGVVEFVGRETDLQNLHERLQQNTAVAISAISGMGGIGKTELALQYAYQHLQTYPGGVCWLKAREELAPQIVLFSRADNRHPPEDMELAAQVSWCWRNWPEQPTLIVLDDVQQWSDIEPVLPTAAHFKMLLTSRAKLGNSVQRYEILVLSEGAALDLLRSLVKDGRIDADLETAKQICKWLGYLPLGLELVGRYLSRKQDLSVAQIWQRLDDKGLKATALMYAKPGMTAKLGVIEAFELSWQDLTESARQLAAVLSLFALADIPWNLVEAFFPEVDPEALEDMRDEELIGLSLLTRSGDGLYNLHQLLREYFLKKLVELEKTTSIAKAVTLKISTLVERNHLILNEILAKKLFEWEWLSSANQISTLEWGWHVRTATQAWKMALGRLAELTMPLCSDGRLPALGVSLFQTNLKTIDSLFNLHTQNAESQMPGTFFEPKLRSTFRSSSNDLISWYLQTAWNLKNTYPEEVIELPLKSFEIFEVNENSKPELVECFQAGWHYFRSVSVKLQASWLWNYTKDPIVSSISQLLNERRIPTKSCNLSMEAAWHGLLYLRSHLDNKIYQPDLSKINNSRKFTLDFIRDYLFTMQNGHFSSMIQHCIKQLNIEVESAHMNGRNDLSIAGAVQNFKENWMSSTAQAEYASYVFWSAIEGYEEIAKTWFSRFYPKLKLASILPVRIIGIITPPKSKSDSIIWTYFFEPLHYGNKNVVEFHIESCQASMKHRLETRERENANRDCFNEIYFSHVIFEQTPHDKDWLGEAPISELVYQWLWRDLKEIGWVKGDLSSSGYPYWR